MTAGETEARLRSFDTLRPGWDSYHAPPPSPKAVAVIRDFLQLASLIGLQPVKVNPSVAGGVGVTYRNGSLSAYAEARNHGSLCYALTGDGRVRVEKADHPADAVLAIRKHLCPESQR